MEAALSENVTPFEGRPSVLAGMNLPPVAEPRQRITMKPPRSALIVDAICKAKPRLKISYLEKVVRPETWAIIKACGDVDRGGDPHIQAINAMHRYMAVNYEREVYGNDDPLLLKFEGWDESNFEEFSAKAGVEITK